MQRRMTGSAAGIALGAFALWSAGTWSFEGRIQTFLRPEAVADRLVYAMLVNLLLGVAGGIAVLRWLVRREVLQPQRSGFGPPVRTALATIVGLALGLAWYLLQGAPSTNPVVVLNAFSQVFVVSVAEVVVCWALVGSTLEAELGPRFGRGATVMAAVFAAALFGLYHFAHSAPFNTWSMVGFLTLIGLFTGTFFFVSRDILATAVFHNFLGTFGVTQALLASDAIRPFETLQVPLLATALLTACVLLGGYVLVRRAR